MLRLKEDIKTGNFKQVYLLYGEEDYLRKQYLDKLKKALMGDGDPMNYHYFEGREINVGALIDTAETMPFFADRRVMVIEESGLFKAEGEKLAEYLKELPEHAFFIFCESNPDKRSRLYKQISQVGYAAEFKKQDERTLKSWIAKILKDEKKKITEDTAAYFIEKVGDDMKNISTELEKLICYCMDKEVVEKADVDAICVNNVANHIFDMVAAIADKKPKVALTLYYDLLALKEQPIGILALISKNMNTLLKLKQLRSKGYDNKGIAEKLGMHPYAVGKNMPQAAKFTEQQLMSAVRKCVEADEAIKTGKLKDTISVEMLILSVL